LAKKALTRIVESFKGPSAFIQTEIGPGAANPGLFDLKISLRR
jgi:P2-related tail formation protein